MAVKNGCAKITNIAEERKAGDNGAVVSDKTSSNSSTQTPKPSFMTSVDSAVNTFTGAVEQVASAFDTSTRQLNAVDCSDMLFDFIKENVPLFGMASAGLNKVTSALNGITSGVSISKLIQEPDFTKNICSFIENWAGMIDGWLDIAIKAAMALYNKIDAARTRLEDATLSLTEAVRACIMDVFNAIRDKIFQTINFSVSINWDALLKHMDECPCICKIIANLTGCTKNDAGVDITDNPAAVKYCIEQKFKFVTPVELSLAVDNLLTKYVRKYIDMVFNYLESWIVYVFNFLIKPLRSLMKMYVNLLRSKMNVTAFIKGLGPFECLFVYTKEYEKGNEFLGMSVIDMVNTYRGWIKCLELACPALSEKIKNKTKQLYKDLRLDDKYWRRVMEADIYTCCIAVDLDGMTPRESVLRQLYSESPWDLLMSLFKKAKNKGDDTSPEEEEYEEYEVNRPITAADMMPSYDNQEPSPIVETVKFTYAPETENAINVGRKPITSGDEKILQSIGDSMVASSKEDFYYVEKFYQLIRFSNKYATSRDYVNHMTEVLENIERPGNDYTSNVENPRGSTSDVRKPDFLDSEGDDIRVEPEYVLISEFDPERSERIANFRFTERKPSESLDAYYARMYASALA